MGLTLIRFGFDGEPPSLRSVYERVCAREDRPVRFVDRQHGVASLLAQRKYDSVGLVRTDRTIEIHGMLGAGLVTPVSHALREMGGQHPLPQADPLNPDYGETWMGTLAEGDDVDILAGDRRFRIWVPYLSEVLANEVAELEVEREAEGEGLGVFSDHDLGVSCEGVGVHRVDKNGSSLGINGRHFAVGTGA